MDIVVFGAGGRAGRAVVAEAGTRGHSARTRRVEVRDASEVAEAARGCGAAVCAVTPASGPGELAALDPREIAPFFADAYGALLGGLTAAGVSRLVLIGLFANLLDASGRQIMDDPAVFPPSLRPFAAAHAAGLERLRAAGPAALDWVLLTPPMALDPAAPRSGRYRLGGETAAESGPLSYADLAVAALDEIDAPTRHRARVAVLAYSGG